MVMSQVPSGVIPSPVLELCRELERVGYRAWVVGGSLRDVLLERTPKDWDLATSATPQQVMQVFKRVIPTGVEHGTVTVLHRGQATRSPRCEGRALTPTAAARTTCTSSPTSSRTWRGATSR